MGLPTESDKSYSICYSTPGHIRAVNHLYGVTTPVLDTARVLELGAGEGYTLYSQALMYPNSRFVGVELESENSLSSQQALLGSAPDNLALFSLSLDDLLCQDIGEYDYIIIHGSFSWLSNDIRDQLLAFCQQHLSPQGCIAIEWECHPGAKINEIIRDAVQIHSSLANDIETQIASSRAMLSWLKLNGVTGEAAFLKSSDTLSDLLISHSLLQTPNEYRYLLEFAGVIETFGLAYVGDLLPWTELAAHYDEKIQHLHNVLSPLNNKILIQQYLDFAVNRGTRFSLLTHSDNAQTVSVLPDLTKLKDLRWAGSFRRQSLQGRILNTLTANSETPVSTDDIATLALLDALGDGWPSSLTFEQLVYNVRQPDLEDKAWREDISQSLSALFLKGLPDLHFSLDKSVYDTCQAAPAQWVAATRGKYAINRWHETVELNDEELSAMSAPTLVVTAQNAQILFSLVKKGMVAAAPKAWRAFLQQLIGHFPAEETWPLVFSLILYSGTEANGGFLPSAIATPGKKKTSMPALAPVEEDFHRQLEKLMQEGRFQQARASIERLVAQRPDNVHVHYLLANFYLRTSDYDAGLKASMSLLSLQSSSWRIFYELSAIFYRKNWRWQAGRLARAILRAEPGYAAAWDLLSSLHREMMEYTLAEMCSRKAIEIEPRSAGIIENLGTILGDQSKMSEAIPYLRRVVELEPGNFNAFTNLLFGLTHSTELTAQELLEEHKQFGQAAERWASKQPFTITHTREEKSRLRIGFVSGDFGRHPVTNFLAPVWYSLDRDRFEIYGYQNSPLQDEVTERLMESACVWSKVTHLSHLEFAEQVKRDGIDILVDLSGHTGYNRLPAFALKPAPVQLSWIGYPGTTGMATVDYYLIDSRFAEPGVLDSAFVEKLIYLPAVQQFHPNKESPDVGPLPALKNGFITFASFNRPKKINDEVVRVWSKILHSIPDARLLIGYMSDSNMVNHFRMLFKEQGINEERLLFRQKMSLHEYLALHNDIDVLLDTFPYTGGTTTWHAIWMGVPTLTIAGDTIASRQCSAGLNFCGLQDFVAVDKEQYIAKAVLLSEQTHALAELRQSLRSRLKEKSVSQVREAIYFERALEIIWQRYCQGLPPAPVVINSDT
ncbi:TPA: methyltransferase regulatory domain-containing protein [Citrobacter koseri]|uniref:O-linked N-acetylglucosamine transferase family protein n=1 Tax=Citrobacter koseri TaxID=545 RepID=UPI0029D3DED6|nr:methyltransferase regulatory domain-containing protein [Citrobacter koseri]HEM8493238.1 methyltransferase regulatory domain-containing protein [Citrobacter koseri]